MPVAQKSIITPKTSVFAVLEVPVWGKTDGVTVESPVEAVVDVEVEVDVELMATVGMGVGVAASPIAILTIELLSTP